jgi:phage repressor protein C with HTH and peptisase S24 domain
MSTRDRIIELMKKNNLKQKDLADKTGANKATVNQWVSGKIIPSNKYDRQLAEALKTSIDYLIHGLDEKKIVKNTEPQAEFVGHIDSWSSNTPLDIDEIEVPFFMDVELAAGLGSELKQENHGPKLRFSRSTLRMCGVQPENAVCVKISGNSMEPRLCHGDVVGVDLGDKKVVDGKIYAINHDGLLRIKQLHLLGGGSIRINSFNKEEYPNEVISNEDKFLVAIIGRIFWSSSIWN